MALGPRSDHARAQPPPYPDRRGRRRPRQPGCGADRRGRERLTADTPKTTVARQHVHRAGGLDAGVRGPATILEAPEGDSRIALVDVRGQGRRRARSPRLGGLQARREVAAQGRDRPARQGRLDEAAQLRVPDLAEREARRRRRRAVRATTSGPSSIYDMAQAVGEKRGAQVALIFGKLLPKGYARESFAGKKRTPARRGAHRRAREVRRDGAKAHRRARRLVRHRAGRQGRVRRRASACASSASRRRSTPTRST